MYYRNTFPEFLETITIGPDPSFIEKNTTNCEFVSAFPQEVELMYDWKKVKRSSNPLNALRNFTKKLLLYGPDLDVQTIKYFVQRFNCYPSYFTDTIKGELILAFERANNIKIQEADINASVGSSGNSYITNHSRLDNDNKFLNKLANLLKSCKKPCNYFTPSSSSIGTLTDFGRALSDSASVLGAAANDLLHAPTNIGTYVLNKIKPMVRTEFFKLKIMTQDLYRDGVKPFFSEKDRQRLKSQLEQGGTPDTKFDRLPLTGDTGTYFVAAGAHSQIQATLQQKIGDCFRMHDYNQRYNPYDPLMNTAYAKRKYMGVKNGNVKSLIDIFGSLAPAQYATENTYANALDVPKQPDFTKYEDLPKAPKYDTYDGPSAAGAAVVTAGGGSTTNPVNASGSAAKQDNGLESTPTAGKVMEFERGKVKITRYGYPKDSTPDPESCVAVGFADNLLVPLKSIAVAPETIKKGMVKKGDILILTCTDKAGNTFQERRQVADQSAENLAGGGKYEFLIDEFQPDKVRYPSKIADRTNDLQVTIQVADTKQPLDKWNVQQASQWASVFYSKHDWDYYLQKAGGRTGVPKMIHTKMSSGEFSEYTKWS
jgi:hypothetical protein